MVDADDSSEPPTGFRVPRFVSWVLTLVSLLLLPSKANVFTYFADPKLDYAEFVVNLPERTLVIAKNSGTSTVNTLNRNIEMQACRPLYDTGGFEPASRGVVPGGSYAIMIAPRRASPEGKVTVDDFEMTTNTLSITTPGDQTRYYFVAFLVIVMAVTLTVQLSQWSFEDGQSHKPSEDEQPFVS